ncbi:MAG: hypothetical protein QM759_11845 [Terricaulis sp.]
MAQHKPRVKVPNRAFGERAMAPFEGFASIFRAPKIANASAKSDEWLRENAVVIVHLAAISLSKGGKTFSFDALLRAAQEISRDIPIGRDRVLSVLGDADVEKFGDVLRLAA